MFRNREEAGKRLAEELGRLFDESPDLAPPVVLALPRGGVPVAYEIARRLDAPLDLVMVRKIGAPMQPELAAGAVVDGEEPIVVLNDEVVSHAGISEADIEQAKRRELKEIEKRREKYLAGRAPLSVKGRTAIVVDDGIATGATMRAAVRAMKKRGPQRVILAVPVGPRESLDRFAQEVDRVVCLDSPRAFMAVGAHYQDFGQTSDDEVSRLMSEAEGFGNG